MASNLEAYLSSSPDPLTVSPFSLRGIKPLPRRSVSARKIISQRSDDGQRERITRSPSKTIAFTAPVEPGSSPWKIRVTVQAESRTEDKGEGGNIESRISKETNTRSVPLKGENKSSPIRRRGRPRKSEAAPGGRKRSLTPARRRLSSVKNVVSNLGTDNDEVLFPAIKPRSGHRRRSRRLELANEAQDDNSTGERGGSPSTDELIRAGTVTSKHRPSQAPNFESLTPLHKKYTKLPQTKASSPRTPDQTMKSVKGRRCTPVKPNGWSEDQLSPMPSDSPSVIAHQDSDFDLSDSDRESVQNTNKDYSGENTRDSKSDTKTTQGETLNLQHFVSPPVRYHEGDDSLGQELETMIADRENQSILSCEDFSVVSIDSLPSRREASSFVGDTSTCDAPKTPGIDSIIANFQIEDSIRDELILERDTAPATFDPKTDTLPTSPTPSAQQVDYGNVNNQHSVLFGSPTAQSASATDGASLRKASIISLSAHEELQTAANPEKSLSNESKGFISRLGGFFMGNHQKTEDKSIQEKQQSTMPEEIYSSHTSIGDLGFSNSKSAENQTKSTQTPKESRKCHGNSIQLPTPEEKADMSATAEQTKNPSSEGNYPDLDQSTNLTQMISPASTTNNDVSEALDESNVTIATVGDISEPLPSDQLREELYQTQHRLTPKLNEYSRGSSCLPIAGHSEKEDESDYPIDRSINIKLVEDKVSSDLYHNSEYDESQESASTPDESLAYDVSGIVDNYQEKLPLSSQTDCSSAAKLRKEDTTSGYVYAHESDTDNSQDASNVSANSLSKEVSENSGNNDVEDSILQEQLRPIPLHHKPSPLHLSRRNMSYILGLHKSPIVCSDRDGQIGPRHRTIRSSPPTLRPCRNLEDRQDRSFQTCQDTDPFIDHQSIIPEDSSMQSDMKQLMNEIDADIPQNEDSCLSQGGNSFSDYSRALSISSGRISNYSTSSSIPSSQSHEIAERSIPKEDSVSIDTSISSKNMLSRLWNSLAFSKPVTDPHLTKYRLLSKVEPWTKTHYKVMDRMYQALKRSPDEFSESNPSNPPLPRAFSSEIGTKMANWGYSVTFTSEHMVLAARFFRLLTLDVDEAASENVEIGDCCPGPAGKMIDEQTVCLRLFSIIVGEDIRRDERAGIPIDRTDRTTVKME